MKQFFKNSRSIILLSFVLMLTACSNEAQQKQNTTAASTLTTATHAIANLNPDDFAQQIQKGGQLIDVRSPDELAEMGQIAKAQNIDYQAADFIQKIGALNKNEPVMVYCATGGRSSETANKKKKMGFTQIYNLEGGFEAWQQANMSVQK